MDHDPRIKAFRKHASDFGITAVKPWAAWQLLAAIDAADPLRQPVADDAALVDAMLDAWFENKRPILPWHRYAMSRVLAVVRARAALEPPASDPVLDAVVLLLKRAIRLASYPSDVKPLNDALAALGEE